MKTLRMFLRNDQAIAWSLAMYELSILRGAWALRMAARRGSR